jgi:glycosyltransferase involved in cell wall biosynthesis
MTMASGSAGSPKLLIVAEAATVHTHKWARYFADEGYAVTVVSQSPGEVAGVRTIQFPSPHAWWTRLPRTRFGGGWQRWIAGWRDWLRLLADVQPDLVHMYFIPAQARDYFYYRGIRNFVVSTHGGDVVFEPGSPPPPAVARRVRSVLRQARLLTATSRFLADETRRFVTDGRPIEVVPFGVDCEQFAPRGRFGSDSAGQTVLGFVKHLNPRYGPQVLLEAFALVHARRPATRLVMAGRGHLEDTLRRRAGELGLGGSVDLLGRVDHADVPALLRSFDIFVMPSVCSEAFGVAALEASASGVPVVASDVGGVPETVLAGRTGLLVPPGDPVALADACLRLIDEPRLRAAMGEAGRRFVLSRYNWPDTAAKMQALYESLLHNTRPAATRAARFPVRGQAGEPGPTIVERKA